jgi:hypothetical protein
VIVSVGVSVGVGVAVGVSAGASVAVSVGVTVSVGVAVTGGSSPSLMMLPLKGCLTMDALTVVGRVPETTNRSVRPSRTRIMAIE